MKAVVSDNDLRYAGITLLIRDGKITRLSKIFDVIPKTRYTEDFGKNYKTFVGKLENPGRFTIEDLLQIANVLSLTLIDVVILVQNDITEYEASHSST